MFCAVAESGTDNRVMISSNGITWTLQESAADNSWLSVCWSPRFAIFCAVARAGTDDRVMTGSATHVILKLYANEVLVATMDVTDGEPFRLPIMRPEEQWSLQIETHDNIKEVVLGTSMSELRR